MLRRVNVQLRRVGQRYGGGVKVRHFLAVLWDLKEKVRASVKRPLAGLRVAAQPGCHLLRPSQIIEFDDPERPAKLDQMIGWLGARPIDYELKALCCGQAFFTIDRQACFKVMADKLAQLRDADCLTTGCPMCFQQFDLNQRIAGLGFNLPILFYYQLLGLAQGLSLADVGWAFHRMKSEKLESFFR
jgi:heterodisulfide reductase subunit B